MRIIISSTKSKVFLAKLEQTKSRVFLAKLEQTKPREQEESNLDLSEIQVKLSRRRRSLDLSEIQVEFSI